MLGLLFHSVLLSILHSAGESGFNPEKDLKPSLYKFLCCENFNRCIIGSYNFVVVKIAYLIFSRQTNHSLGFCLVLFIYLIKSVNASRKHFKKMRVCTHRMTRSLSHGYYGDYLLQIKTWTFSNLKS